MSESNAQPDIKKGAMAEVIQEYMFMYLDANGIALTDEAYDKAYKGIEYWLHENLPVATSDSITNVM